MFAAGAGVAPLPGDAPVRSPHLPFTPDCRSVASAIGIPAPPEGREAAAGRVRGAEVRWDLAEDGAEVLRQAVRCEGYQGRVIVEVGLAPGRHPFEPGEGSHAGGEGLGPVG